MDYYVVCDGHGAKNRLGAGHVAYTIVHGYEDILPLHQELYNNLNEINFDVSRNIDVIENTFKNYDMKMHTKQCFGGSCVCIILVIDKKYIYLVNLGDSRACIWNETGILGKTVDHGYDNEDEKKRIRNFDGFLIFGRLFGVISTFRAFGNWELKLDKGIYIPDGALTSVPEIFMYSPTSKVSGVITSDSFRDIQMSPENLVKIINKCPSKREIGKNIVESVKYLSEKKGYYHCTSDDISVVYIENLLK